MLQGDDIITFSEIEMLAYRREPLPMRSTTIESACYQAMRYLYCRYERGDITHAAAKEEKKNIQRAFEHDEMLYRMYKTGAERQRLASVLSKDIESSGCKLCRSLMQMMDGRARSTDKEETNESTL